MCRAVCAGDITLPAAPAIFSAIGAQWRNRGTERLWRIAPQMPNGSVVDVFAAIFPPKLIGHEGNHGLWRLFGRSQAEARMP
jgi:hypothetical protein